MKRVSFLYCVTIPLFLIFSISCQEKNGKLETAKKFLKYVEAQDTISVERQTTFYESEGALKRSVKLAASIIKEYGLPQDDKIKCSEEGPCTKVFFLFHKAENDDDKVKEISIAVYVSNIPNGKPICYMIVTKIDLRNFNLNFGQ